MARASIHLRRQAVPLRRRRAAGDAARRGRRPRPAAAGGAGADRARRSADASTPSADSPDGTLRASSTTRTATSIWSIRHQGRDRHHHRRQREGRIKYGTASWVYGEELDQITAMWWSPDSRKLAFYRFDESSVPDYYLQLDQTKLQSTVDTEAYPKAGAPNPIVDLLIYDVASKKTTKVDVRDGKPFTNDVVGHYAYHVNWIARRHGAAVQPHQPPPEHPRDGGRRAGQRGSAGRASRRVADRLDREQPDHGVPEGQPPVHLAIRAERLEQLLSLRSRRQADCPADHPHHVRSGGAGQGRRGGRRDVLHGARRRQSAQAAAASRRPRWPRRRPPDRPEVPPHGRLLHGRRGRRPRPRRRRRAAAIAADNKHFVDVYQTHDTPPATRVVDAASGKSSRKSPRAT